MNLSKRQPKRHVNQRRGAVIAWFALFLLVVISLSALVIDVGATILARRQMVGSSESAAVVALRYNSGVPETMDDAPLTDQRALARNMLAAHYRRFLDDSQAANGLGAGLAIEFEPNSGTQLAGTNLIASEGIRTIGQWQPEIEQGDSQSQSESSDIYVTATDAAVQLRRSGPVATSAGESFGPRVPMIFSRGMLARDATGVSASSHAADGITVNVRRTSALRPVVTVGPAADLTTADNQSKRVAGLVRYVLTTPQFAAAIAGDAIANTGLLAINTLAAPLRATSIGRRVSLETLSLPADSMTDRNYVAIVEEVAVQAGPLPGTNEHRVVGFVAVASIEFGQETTTFVIDTNQAANENASAAFTLAPPAVLSATQQQTDLKTAWAEFKALPLALKLASP